MSLFKHLKITLPTDAELEVALAGLGSRAYAILIDYHLVGLAIFLVWLLAIVLAGPIVQHLITLGLSENAAVLLLLAAGCLLSIAIYGGYFIGFEALWQGQTPGKRWVKIRVIQENGCSVGWTQASLRTLLRPLDDFCFIGLFLIFFSQREQRLGDRLAKTIVIQEAQAQPPTLAISPTAQQLATQLPALIDLAQLQPDDMAVIHAYLQRRDEIEAKPRRDLSLKLAREIRAIVQLAEIPAGLTSDQFLEAVYWAYHHQHP